MKRILSIVLPFAAFLGILASCENGEGEVVSVVKTLQIVESNLVFLPEPESEGLIRFEAVDPVTATSDKAWCHVTVDNSAKTVSVTVDKNRDNETRYSRITLRSGDETLHITAQQMGEVLAGLSFSDVTAPVEGTELVFPVTTNLKIDIASDKGWIVPVVKEEKGGSRIVITIAPNTATGVRTGVVTFSAGAHSGSFNVLQYPEVVRNQGWTLGVEDGEFAYPHQLNNVTVKADASVADQQYVFTAVPKAAVTGDIKDYIFDVFAMAAKNAIDAKVADGTLPSFSAGLLSGDQSKVVEDLPATAYVILVGFDDTGYVTGLYNWAEVSVKDMMPAYYRWAGKWQITGRTVPYTGVTFTGSEVWTISVDEDALENTLTVRGMNSHTTPVVLENDADAMKLTYDPATGTVALHAQEGKKFYYDATYGESLLYPQGLYTRNGTSWSRVTGTYMIFKAELSADRNSASITPGVRNYNGVDYDYDGFRLFFVAGTGNTYSLGATSGVVPIPFEMTRMAE